VIPAILSAAAVRKGSKERILALRWTAATILADLTMYRRVPKRLREKIGAEVFALWMID
jgi:hypothetical protein